MVLHHAGHVPCFGASYAYGEMGFSACMTAWLAISSLQKTFSGS